MIEYFIQASDVTLIMQHCHIYCKWNKRLFQETKKTNVNKMLPLTKLYILQKHMRLLSVQVKLVCKLFIFFIIRFNAYLYYSLFYILHKYYSLFYKLHNLIVSIFCIFLHRLFPKLPIGPISTQWKQL